jgi:transposase
MMGCKERDFGPLDGLDLDALVPTDNFYRHVEKALDLDFVRDLVCDSYAVLGRPSIDPVVFFKLQLVLFFEGLRSERQLMRVVADRLSLRWYVGYDLGEPLPDHSSLTRIRDRYGLEILRRFFEAIVEQCQQAGLVWGKELYVDATKVEANASLDSIGPRFAIEAHLRDLFASEEAAAPPADAAPPTPLSVPISEAAKEELAAANTARHDWFARDGEPDRLVSRGHYQRLSDFRASATDPDAGLMQTRGGAHPGYLDQYVVDGGRARVILNVLVTPADVTENLPMLDLLWRTCFRWKLWPDQATGDTTYATIENIVAIEDAGIRAYVPLPDFDHRTEFFGKGEFTYDADQDVYRCPQGQTLRFRKNSYSEGVRVYRADAATCNGCQLKKKCTPGKNGRQIKRPFDEEYVERVRGYQDTERCQKAIRKRNVWVEPLFGEAKQWHNLWRFRLRRLRKVNGEALLTATGQNLKRLLSKRGWGHRHFPSGAPGVRLAVTESQRSP